jgi:hypothetical protein
MALVVPYGGISAKYDQGLASESVCRLAAALRLHKIEHGAYPEKLAALVPDVLPKLPVDPFSGKDYVYRREGKGYIVYSVGQDGVDSGGKEDTPCTPDIVVECSR